MTVTTRQALGILAWLAEHPKSNAEEVSIFADRTRAWAWAALRQLEANGLVNSELDNGHVNRPRLWSVAPVRYVCAHCGLVCGGFAGGFGGISDSRAVCHPNDTTRPDCYRRITVYQEPVGILIDVNPKPAGITDIRPCPECQS
jgi:hypothetical protein